MTDGKDIALVAAVRELTAEFRRVRRWRLLRVMLLAGIVLAAVFSVNWGESSSMLDGEEHTAMVDIFGVISQEYAANSDYITKGLRAAFEESQAKGVVLRINSPGGSPVQAHRIYEEIHRLRLAHPDKPVYAVAEDMCVSAAYYVAMAAQEVHVDESSLVGSIGVIASSFGLVELIDRWGIERRVTKSGEYKDVLDPFQPQDIEHKVYLKQIIDTLHQRFVSIVQESRGEHLNTTSDPLYDGRIWTGKRALQLGLVDGFASVDQLAREQIGAELVVNYSYEPGFLEQFSEEMGAQITQWLETRLRMPQLY